MLWLNDSHVVLANANLRNILKNCECVGTTLPLLLYYFPCYIIGSFTREIFICTYKQESEKCRIRKI